MFGKWRVGCRKQTYIQGWPNWFDGMPKVYQIINTRYSSILNYLYTGRHVPRLNMLTFPT
jgi:hypothetical protein